LFEAREKMTADPESLVGSTLGGSYTVLRLLGHGGMGAVYEAQGARLPDKRFAVKVLTVARGPRSEEYRRFHQEATIISRLGHPNIVAVVDFDHTDQGLPFMVMEHLEGEDLQQLLEREGALPMERALPLFSGVCAGLQAAHEQGVVHRDIKPQNIFIQRAGQEQVPKLLDFGISKLHGAGAGLTASRATMGTPHYMSPEQAWGVTEKMGPRSDLFSLGAVMYRALGGRLPFEGDSLPAVIHAVTSHDPEPLHRVNSAVPAAVSTVVAQAMAREPEQRQASAAELLAQLQQAAERHEPPAVAHRAGATHEEEAPTVVASESPAPTPRKRRGALLPGGILLGLLLLFGAAALLMAREDGRPSVASLADKPGTRGLRDAGGDMAPGHGNALAAALRAVAPDLAACYAPALAREPDLEGSVDFKLVFGDRGQVLQATVERDGLGDAGVGACAAARLRAGLGPIRALAGKVVKATHLFMPTRTLAVLPFDNLSGDQALAWLQGGMAEALVSRLGQVPHVVLLEQARVRSLLSRGDPAERQEAALLAAARKAGAELLLRGAFQRIGQQVRITARLVRVKSGKIRSVAQTTGALEQVFSLQDGLARDLTRALGSAKTPTSADRAARGGATLAVLRLLGQAHNALMAGGAAGNLSRAEALYRQVLQAAEAMPEAHRGLAMALWPRRDGAGGKVNAEIKAHLERALELRPTYYEALSSLGFILWSEQRHERAFALQQRALRLKPTYALGYYGLGLGHATRGNSEQALTLLRQAVELDPRNSEFHTQLGICVAAFKRDFEAALLHTGRALQQPGAVLWNHVNHAFMQLMTGDAAACLRTLEGNPDAGPYNSPHQGQRLLVRAACLAKLGQRARAREVIASAPARDRALVGAALPPGLPAYLKILLGDLRKVLSGITPQGASAR